MADDCKEQLSETNIRTLEDMLSSEILLKRVPDAQGTESPTLAIPAFLQSAVLYRNRVRTRGAICARNVPTPKAQGLSFETATIARQFRVRTARYN